MVVAPYTLYCRRSENPFDLRPLNTEVASVVRQALPLIDALDDSCSVALATSSLVARANASLPPGAWVTRSSSLLSPAILMRELDQPSPSPP